MSTVVRVSETYDLSTKLGKIGVLGIHTPPRAMLELHYGGLMQNHKKVRFLGCDVAFASAARLPLDPLQISDNGTDLVHPADAMNPILYKAVSNDSFNAMLARIYGAKNIQPSSFGGSVDRSEGISDDAYQFGQHVAWANMSDLDIYYGMLSADSGWKKAMPQTGFAMRGLAPLAYPMLSQFGNVNLPTGNDPRQIPQQREPFQSDADTYTFDFPNTANGTLGRWFRGRAVRCPALPLWSGWSGGSLSNNASGHTGEKDATLQATSLPTCYVGAVIVPPVQHNGSILYYRMRVTWTVRFEDVCSVRELMPFFGGWNYAGMNTYWADYETGSKQMERTDSMVDSDGFEIDKVMEG